MPGFYTCHFSRYFCSLLASLFFRYGHGLYFPCQRPLPESAQLLATVLLHASHNVFVRSIFHAAAENGPYTQYYQLFLLFVLPIKIRMS